MTETEIMKLVEEIKDDSTRLYYLDYKDGAVRDVLLKLCIQNFNRIQDVHRAAITNGDADGAKFIIDEFIALVHGSDAYNGWLNHFMRTINCMDYTLTDEQWIVLLKREKTLIGDFSDKAKTKAVCLFVGIDHLNTFPEELLTKEFLDELGFKEHVETLINKEEEEENNYTVFIDSSDYKCNKPSDGNLTSLLKKAPEDYFDQVFYDLLVEKKDFAEDYNLMLLIPEKYRTDEMIMVYLKKHYDDKNFNKLIFSLSDLNRLKELK